MTDMPRLQAAVLAETAATPPGETGWEWYARHGFAPYEVPQALAHIAMAPETPPPGDPERDTLMFMMGVVCGRVVPAPSKHFTTVGGGRIHGDMVDEYRVTCSCGFTLGDLLTNEKAHEVAAVHRLTGYAVAIIQPPGEAT